MTLQEQSQLAQDNEFRGRVQTAVLKAAGQLLGNPAQEFIVHKYAEHVKSNIGGSWLNNYVYLLVNSFNTDPTDVELQNEVNGNFPTMAKNHYRNI